MQELQRTTSVERILDTVPAPSHFKPPIFELPDFREGMTLLKNNFYERAWSLCNGESSKTAFKRINALLTILPKKQKHAIIETYQVTELFGKAREDDEFLLTNNAKIIGKPASLGLEEILILPISDGVANVKLVATQLSTRRRSDLLLSAGLSNISSEKQMNVITTASHVIATTRIGKNLAVCFWDVIPIRFLNCDVSPIYTHILPDWVPVGAPLICSAKLYQAANTVEGKGKIFIWNLEDITRAPTEVEVGAPLEAFEINQHWAIMAHPDFIEVRDSVTFITIRKILCHGMGSTHQVRTSGGRLLFSNSSGIWSHLFEDSVDKLTQVLQPSDVNLAFEVIKTHLLVIGLPKGKESQARDLSFLHQDLNQSQKVTEPLLQPSQGGDAHLLVVNGVIVVASPRTVHRITFTEKIPAPNTVDIDVDEPVVPVWRDIAYRVASVAWWLVTRPFAKYF